MARSRSSTVRRTHDPTLVQSNRSVLVYLVVSRGQNVGAGAGAWRRVRTRGWLARVHRVHRIDVQDEDPCLCVATGGFRSAPASENHSGACVRHEPMPEVPNRAVWIVQGRL